MKLYGVFGAGGFAKEAMPLARDYIKALGVNGSDSELVFVVEDKFHTSEHLVNGHRVMSMSEFISVPISKKFYNIAIGDSKVRNRISNDLSLNVAKPFSIIAQNHVALDNNIIGEGAILCNFTHITSNTKIGRFFHCNIYSYVAHDCVIGDYVTFAPGVMCNGHVIVEDHAYIGTGAVIKDGTTRPIVIGYGATVGMGAVVTKSVPPGVTVVGNPAKVLNVS